MRIAALMMLLLATGAAAAAQHHPRHRHRVPSSSPATSQKWSSVETDSTADMRPNGPVDQSPGWGSYAAQARAVDAAGSYGAYSGATAPGTTEADAPAPRGRRPR